MNKNAGTYSVKATYKNWNNKNKTNMKNIVTISRKLSKSDGTDVSSELLNSRSNYPRFRINLKNLDRGAYQLEETFKFNED
jgi:hypothetical protein